MKLDLTDTESKELAALLDQALGDYSMEIADTDNGAFRRELESRRASLQEVRAKLGSDPERDWLIDEQGDESFPASDPPAH